MGLQLLGGLSPASFLIEYWQKKPMLVRQAIPGFTGVVPPSGLMRLGGREEVESRLFIRRGSRWSVRDGPLPRAAFSGLPRTNWTLLVHGLNLHVPAADQLLRRFAFIPYARLDDVLVSYAVDGGGVGAHVDSYDVFLLQGEGRRRWRVGAQRDRSLDPRAPHRVLARFRPQREWILGPGDMLYLPPGCAHEGTAIGACTTYSIGFRAPSAQELGTAYLSYLGDRLRLQGMYTDPDLQTQEHPAAIPAAMARKARHLLAPLGCRESEIRRFLGTYLSEPKPQVAFIAPREPLSERRFFAAVQRYGLRLSPRTLMLFDQTCLFVNGEVMAIPRRNPLRTLADQRSLSPGVRLSRPLLSQLYRWYRDGWLLTGMQHE